MSHGNHDPSDEAHDDAADARDDHHGPPPPPEPKTPLWLPAVGGALFLTVGLSWALSTPPKDPTETMATPDPAAASAQPAPTQTAVTPPKPPTPVPTPPPTPANTAPGLRQAPGLAPSVAKPAPKRPAGHP